MPKFSSELTDPAKLARELYDFWMTTMRTDRVVGKTDYVTQVETSWDNLHLDKAVLFMEALKSMVINRFCMEAQQYESIQASLPLIDGDIFDEEIGHKKLQDMHQDVSVDFEAYEPDRSYSCYYCGRSNAVSGIGRACDECKRG